MLLSFLAYNTFTGEVTGINELQEQYSAKYGPGDYSPSVFITYWSFRIMIGIRFLDGFPGLRLFVYLDKTEIQDQEHGGGIH